MKAKRRKKSILENCDKATGVTGKCGREARDKG